VLISFLLVALGLTFAPRFYQWYYSVPLIDAVKEFNANNLRVGIRGLAVPMPVPFLSDGEVVASISTQLLTLNAPDKVEAILAEIERTHLLPYNAKLSLSTFPPGGYAIDVDIMLDAKNGYTFRVRDRSTPNIVRRIFSQ
jgi:hypothetical protein